jgi:hypothetical protein
VAALVWINFQEFEIKKGMLDSAFQQRPVPVVGSERKLDSRLHQKFPSNSMSRMKF